MLPFISTFLPLPLFFVFVLGCVWVCVCACVCVCVWSIWVTHGCMLSVMFICLVGQPSVVLPSVRFSCLEKTSMLILFNQILPDMSYLQAPLTLPVLPLPVTLTWLHVARSAQSKTCWLHFVAQFLVNGMKFVMMMKQFKLNIPSLLVCVIYWTKGNNCCFTDYQKILALIGHLWSSLIPTCYGDKYSKIHILLLD